MLVFDRKTWPAHRPWMIFFLLATIASTAAFFAFAYGPYGDPTGWPGGSSLPGLIFGVLGGLIILFEFLLWFRKKVRVWRIGRAASLAESAHLARPSMRPLADLSQRLSPGRIA